MYDDSDKKSTHLILIRCENETEYKSALERIGGDLCFDVVHGPITDPLWDVKAQGELAGSKQTWFLGRVVEDLRVKLNKADDPEMIERAEKYLAIVDHERALGGILKRRASELIDTGKEITRDL